MTLSPYFLQLTGAQRELLASLSRGGRYIRGGAVRTAQSLERRGFVKLTDNGSLGTGNSDGERWWVEKVGR